MAKVGQFVRAEKLLKIGDKLTPIMKKRKLDAKFLGLVCDIDVSAIKDIASNKCPVDMAQLCKLAEALAVDKEELKPQFRPVSIGSGHIGKIVGILKSEMQNASAAILIHSGTLIDRPFWSSSFRAHILLGDKIEIIYPKSLTHILSVRHCCMYQSVENLDRYDTLVRSMGCGFKFCNTNLECARTNNNYYILLPRLGKNVDFQAMKVSRSLPLIPKSKINLG